MKRNFQHLCRMSTHPAPEADVSQVSLMVGRPCLGLFLPWSQEHRAWRGGWGLPGLFLGDSHQLMHLPFGCVYRLTQPVRSPSEGPGAVGCFTMLPAWQPLAAQWLHAAQRPWGCRHLTSSATAHCRCLDPDQPLPEPLGASPPDHSCPLIPCVAWAGQ